MDRDSNERTRKIAPSGPNIVGHDVSTAFKGALSGGEIVLDPLVDRATTLIAAEKTGRLARLIEFDPAYCDSALRRFEKLTGREARLQATGEGFEAVTEARAASMLQERGEAGHA